jgi:hypothetical protein
MTTAQTRAHRQEAEFALTSARRLAEGVLVACGLNGEPRPTIPCVPEAREADQQHRPS